ncbi:hypothetical protein BLN97_36395 [Bradyrhizobium elkanii]|nr:hypothetical protein BLN97_36395 [Bradyrhizobium elkanii]
MPPISAEAQPRRTLRIMDLAEGHSLIGRAGRAFQSQQDTPARAHQSEKPVERHIMVKQPTRIGPTQFADEKLEQFRCRAML